MEIRGRRPRIFGVQTPPSLDDDSFNQLSAPSGSGGDGSNSICVSVESPAANEERTNLDILFDGAVIATTMSGGVSAANDVGRGATATAGGVIGGNGGEEEKTTDIGALMRVLEEGLIQGQERAGPLEWGWLSHEEAADRAKTIYREAAHAQVNGFPACLCPRGREEMFD